MSRRAESFLVTCLLLVAAGLRVYHLNRVPPGWRDDEIIETVVHAQIVLDGKFPLYFPQAEGHEPLYHYLSAGLIALAGRSLFTVRLLSAFFGLLSLAALYRLARRLFGRPTALIAGAALAVSFWGLMYSRFKVRHISEVGFMLLAYDFFLTPVVARSPRRRDSLCAALCLALCLYTYFAARVVPVILLAFMAYVLLFHRARFRAAWRSAALAFLLAGALAAPLAWAIAHTPGGEARLSVVGRPLLDLLQGDARYVLSNTRETLGMFAFTGDPEYLYNIPRRPVFEWLSATLFLAGVLVSAWHWRQPRHAFLLVWLAGGLAPAFVSTPAASFGHTIAAQPVVYLFPAIALASGSAVLKAFNQAHPIQARARGPLGGFVTWWPKALSALGACLFLGLTAARDLPDYFVRWPRVPQVRYLYRADLHEAAQWLNAHSPAAQAVALSSRDLNQADVTALRLDTPALHLQPRLFNPASAWMFPNDNALAVLRESAPATGEFGQESFQASFAIRATGYGSGYRPAVPLSASFANGWDCLGYSLVRQPDPRSLRLYIYWRIGPAFTPPPPRPVEILSGAPIPLRIFSHVLTPSGAYLAGDDRLDVDPATLRPGDDFIQRLEIALPSDLPPGDYPVEAGLYNPVTGERVLLSTGEDHLALTTLALQP